MPNRIDVKTTLLKWAVERAGLDVNSFNEKFSGFNDWIKENKKPTVKQLEKFANKVHVPFGYLLLEKPPKEDLPITFYRTNDGETSEVSINVYDTVLDIKKRQEWLIEYLENNEYDELPFVGKYNIDADYKIIAEDIRKTLDLPKNWTSSFSSWEKTLEYLTEKIEEIGIIIIFNSIVRNNTHRPISVDECRGFVLVDKYAPFMFVNSADAKAAQLFTILHELAHIWTGQSAGFDFRQLQPANFPTEKLCDKVSAEFLVPADLFISKWNDDIDFKLLSKHFKVSPIVIARRALDLKLISRNDFFEFYDNYKSSTKNKNQSSGGDFYRTAKKRISLKFASYIKHAVQSGQLLYLDAYKLTGLKGNTFNKLFKEYIDL